MIEISPEAVEALATILESQNDYFTAPKLRVPRAALTEAEAAQAAAVENAQPITLTYTNYRGETAARTIIPIRVWFGATEWHPEPQWLLTAFDIEKCENRDFALQDFGEPVAAAVAAEVSLIADDFDYPDSNVDEFLDQNICCNGQDCGCQGRSVGSYLQYRIRATITPTGRAALDAALADARETALREAAALIDGDYDRPRDEYGDCPHGAYMGDDCHACTKAAILALIPKGGA